MCSSEITIRHADFVVVSFSHIKTVIGDLGKFEDETKDRGLGESEPFVLAFQTSSTERETLHKKYESAEMSDEERTDWLLSLDEQLKRFDKYNKRDLRYSLILGRATFQDLGNVCSILDDLAHVGTLFMNNITELSYVKQGDVSIMYVEFDFYM
jgi:hypothetical protein